MSTRWGSASEDCNLFGHFFLHLLLDTRDLENVMNPTFYVNDAYSEKTVFVSPGDKTLPMIVCKKYSNWDKVLTAYENPTKSKGIG